MSIKKIVFGSVLALSSLNIQAALVSYSDRGVFEAAVGAGIVTEDFESFASSNFHEYSGSDFNATADATFSSEHWYYCENSNGCGGINPFDQPSDTNDYFWAYINNPITFTFTETIYSFGLDVGSNYQDGASFTLMAPDSTQIISGPIPYGSDSFLGFINTNGWSSGQQFSLALTNMSFAAWDNLSYSESIGPVSAVPVPAAVWLFGSALAGFAGFSRFKKKA